MADLDVRVRLTGESGQLVGQLKGVAGAEAEVATQATKMAQAAESAAVSTGKLDAAGRKAAAGLRTVRQAGQATGTGLQGLGIQFGDFTTQVSLGSNVFQAFGAQAGQAAYAMQSLGGTAGRVGTFLAGPWGSLIIAAVTVVGVFATKLLGAADAAEEVKFASYDLGNAQSALGNVIDITTGKIKNQSSALLALARAQAIAGQIKARADIADARSSLSSQKVGVDVTSGFGGGIRVSRNEGDVLAKGVASAMLDGSMKYNEGIAALNSFRRTGKITEDQFIATAQSIVQLGVASENLKAFEGVDRLLTGTGTAADRSLLLKPGKDKKPPKGPKDNSAAEAERLAQFGARAAESITRITEQFDAQPKLIDRVNAAQRQLSAIVDDLNKKQPKGFRDMIAEAQRAKAVVQDALLRPFGDYLQAQQRSRDIQSLVIAGREDEADALAVIFRLQDQVGTVTEAQRQTILATIKAEREQNEVLEQRNVIAGAYTSAIQDARTAVERLLSGDLSGKDFLKNLRASFNQLRAKVLTEQLLGPFFRDLDKTVQERTGIQSSVNIFKAGTESAGKAGGSMAEALHRAENRIDGMFGGSPSGESSASTAPIAPLLRGQLGSDFDAVVDGLAANVEGTNEIVAVARKMAAGPMGMTPVQFLDLLTGGLVGPLMGPLTQLLGPKLAGTLTGALAGAGAGYLRAGKVGAVLGGLEGIPALSKGIDKLFKSTGVLKGALDGAATGTAVAGIGKALGLKMSSTGAQLGGAIGSFIPIPGGEIIGSLLGGLAGGLLKKSKTGSATITGGSGDPTLSGNNAGFKKAAGGLAGSVQEGLNSIADQLGAQLGSFAVSIGIRDGKYRVDPTGKGATKKSKGALDFGKDGAEEAVSAAIADAIRDGALQGLSAAVQRAVQSNGDASKALAEALKVRDLEKALGGFAGSALDAFQQFERQSKERLRIATTYGLAINKVEELNARDRVKLREQLERESFGSLQDLLTRLRSGDLFEGSAVDQRNVLLGQIEAAKASAAAGDEGASDKLAALLEQLNTVSKDVFGTSGGFAGDRSSIESTAESVISLLRQKLDDASAQAGTGSLTQTNALLDENSDQNAIMIAALQAIRDSVSAGGGTGGISEGGGWTIAQLAGLSYTGYQFL